MPFFRNEAVEYFVIITLKAILIEQNPLQDSVKYIIK